MHPGFGTRLLGEDSSTLSLPSGSGELFFPLLKQPFYAPWIWDSSSGGGLIYTVTTQWEWGVSFQRNFHSSNIQPLVCDTSDKLQSIKAAHLHIQPACPPINIQLHFSIAGLQTGIQNFIVSRHYILLLIHHIGI